MMELGIPAPQSRLPAPAPCAGALPPCWEHPHTQYLPSPSPAGVLTATSRQWVTHIFFR